MSWCDRGGGDGGNGGSSAAGVGAEAVGVNSVTVPVETWHVAHGERPNFAAVCEGETLEQRVEVNSSAETRKGRLRMVNAEAWSRNTSNARGSVRPMN